MSRCTEYSLYFLGISLYNIERVGSGLPPFHVNNSKGAIEMKKFGKFLFSTAALAAVGAGVYYAYKKFVADDQDIDDDDDFIDDLDDFDLDDDDEDASNSPEYVSVASDAVDKAKDAAEDVADAAKDVLNNISDAVKDVTE